MPLAYHIDPASSATVSLAPQLGKVAIYGLYDPRDGQLRYIGKAVKPHIRYTKHTHPDVQQKRVRVSRWIMHLQSLDLAPILRVLDWVPVADWVAVERSYIAQAKADGIDLANLSEGGDGNEGTKHGPEARAKVSAAQKGRPKSAEARANIGAAARGRITPEETRAKQSAAMKVYANSPEGKEARRRAGQKAAEVHNAFWAKYRAERGWSPSHTERNDKESMR